MFYLHYFIAGCILYALDYRYNTQANRKIVVDAGWNAIPVAKGLIKLCQVNLNTNSQYVSYLLQERMLLILHAGLSF